MWRSVPTGEGRLREFARCGIDVRGYPSTSTDAEIVHALAEGLDPLGVRRYRFLVNSRNSLRSLLFPSR